MTMTEITIFELEFHSSHHSNSRLSVWKKEETLDFVLGGIANLCHIDTQKPTVAVCRLRQTWADGREGHGHGGVHCIADQNLLYFPNDFCTKITQGKCELKNEYNIDWSSNFVLVKLKCEVPHRKA